MQLSKHICKIIINLVENDKNITKYAEPFCGMMRVGIEIMKNTKIKL